MIKKLRFLPADSGTERIISQNPPLSLIIEENFTVSTFSKENPMTLQQLRYIIAIVQAGSLNMAARALFISQPSLSKSMGELEKEMGITLFRRTSRGMVLTEEGVKFLSYARQVVEQADLLENAYKKGAPVKRVFAISSQHYAFVVNAFVALVKEYGREKYEFTLRESRTYDIIEDVRLGRSELGILFLDHFRKDVLLHILKEADMDFHPLFKAPVHVFLSRRHPLAGRSLVTLEDLLPYPRLTYEQGIHNSLYFSEEPLIQKYSPKNIIVTDRATLFNLLIGLDGYTICSGILSKDLNGTDILSLPLQSSEEMTLGYITPKGTVLRGMARRYMDHLKTYIGNLEGIKLAEDFLSDMKQS
ncbi:LysR family transcriptional regulator [uncultured Dialister sp.]|uniref:LysR family transcriptional regulator n=1 Tax=uncultured Dialister sp. TaxID=278064 RepID=UPI002658DC23|nr:LysR family transcriptional regulator [uncultured Dialister sp.]